MAMNDWLAEIYNTPAPADEEVQKVANADMFAKIATQHGIDLGALPPEQVGELYAQVFPEEAAKISAEGEEEKCADCGKVDCSCDKKEAAAVHWQEKRAFQEKFAEADTMGRVMAHSFVQERGYIEKGANKYTAGWDQTFGPKGITKLVGMAKAKGGAAGSYVKGKATAGGRYVSDKATEGGRYVKDKATAGAAAAADTAAGKHVLRNKGKYTAGAAGAAGLGVGAGAGSAMSNGKKKESSAEAFEELAGNYAIDLAKEAGFNEDEAIELVNAVYTLGLGESDKIAHVQDFDSGVHVRALEYLEGAGYPVDWSEVF